MTQTEALSGAIFAINTFMHPDASEPSDVAWLEENSDRIIETLAGMRSFLG